jgi:integrase
VLVDGAVPLRPEPALFEAMLEGWRRQQAARRLTGPLIEGRVRLVRRFAAFAGAWPWQWTPRQAGQWVASGGWAHSTVRSYEGALAAFLGYMCDPRYGWIAECEQQVGARPVQVCHEGNTAVHAAGYEGRPERRPLTRAELQAFLDAADDHVARAAASRRKGWLAAFRDATLFKVIYGWGLFSGVRRCAGGLSFRVYAAQRLLDERLPVATGVVQAAWPQVPGRRVAGSCAAWR